MFVAVTVGVTDEVTDGVGVFDAVTVAVIVGVTEAVTVGVIVLSVSMLIVV